MEPSRLMQVSKLHPQKSIKVEHIEAPKIEAAPQSGISSIPKNGVTEFTTVNGQSNSLDFDFEGFFNLSYPILQPNEWIIHPPICSLKERELKHEQTGDLQKVADIEHCQPSTNKHALMRIMMKLQFAERIGYSDICMLSLVDLSLLQSIAKRKYGVVIAPRDFEDKKKLVMELNSLESQKKSEKRLEENYKLIFKRALKKLVRKYKKEHGQVMIAGSSRKRFFETMACLQYFSIEDLPVEVIEQEKANFEAKLEKMIAKRSKINSNPSKKALIDPFNPKNPSALTYQDEALRKFVVNPTTINSRFIQFLFKSTSFKDFFDDFVDNHFIADYRKIRATKMLKIFDSLYAWFDASEGDLAKTVEDLKVYIEKNPKFKLPWTESELRACITCTTSSILKLFQSKSRRDSQASVTKRDRNGRFTV